MKVLVTGANGMLGQDLCPIFEKEGFEVIKTDYDTMDITDFEAAKKVILENNPNLIIHCAAYTNVDKAEDDYDSAYKLNVEGTANIAKIAGEADIAMAYISTDYVFDGSKDSPYLPEDKPNPLNVYGKTKFLGEQEVQKYCKRYYIVRTSWLYGLHGRNFVETMINIAQNKWEKAEQDPIKVVNDQTGSPTWTVDLSYGIIKLFNMAFGTYHLSGAGETTWYDFCKKIFELEDINVNLVPCSTEEFKRKAKRPSYSYLENIGLLRNWDEALKDYLKLRKEK